MAERLTVVAHENVNPLMQEVIDRRHPKIRNKWFRNSAFAIARNANCNIQIAYWRIKCLTQQSTDEEDY